MLDEILGRPVLTSATHPDEEVAEYVDPTLGVRDLRMKLDAEEIAASVLDGGER